VEVLRELPFGRIVTTDTVPQRADLPLPVTVASVAPLLADVVGRLHRSETLREMLVHR